ncbi:hypothetical protein Dsin_001569 [Dipteronia sinensis]|uniref:RNase H type-1 domain-containing protein n=1 Tax=Dipteronia sinensis TaxID=43782 RepID=A0AAE0EIG4_9ROSI|nr:hypothetical protein Dsin_001569 [Dipteronia sinensis]
MVSNSMDPMSMEASLYITSSAGSSVVPSRPHVSLRPYGGEAVDGWADPLQGSSSLPVQGSLPRCEAVVGVVDPLVDNVSGPSILSKKGGYVAVRVDPSAYKSRLEVCKFSFIGRVVLSSGEKPWKLVDLKAKLQSVWKLNSVWRLICLGKGYFQIMLNLDADKNMVSSLGSLNLKPGVLRLQPWIPDFNPALQKSSNAQIWVRFYALSLEYWHLKIISDLARGIGVPLWLDRATMKGDFRHFARVLVDIDVSTVPPSSLLLKRDDSADSWSSFFSQAMSVSFSDQMQVLWKTVIHAVVLPVTNDLLILRRLDLRGRPARAPVIMSVIWSPPASGWIKVNTDGAALSSPGVGDCGGVFRNCRAFVKGCFAVPLGVVFAFEVELFAGSMAINLAWQNGWHQIWLESDSSYMVHLLAPRFEQVLWRIRQAWQHCIYQISNMEFHVSHIFREGNQVADAFSKHALGLAVDSWWTNTPSFCYLLVGNDCMGRESFCFS